MNDRLVRALEVSTAAAHHRDRCELADRVLRIRFQVPANRIGYGEFTVVQLKVIQEVITLAVFSVFAWVYFGKKLKWNHAVAFLFLIGAVTFAFWGKL